MDIAVFHPLKITWKKAVDSFRAEFNLRAILQEEFCIILKKALDGILSKTVARGFQANELYPFSIDEVNRKKLFMWNEYTNKNTKKGENVLHSHNKVLNHLLYFESIIGEQKLSNFKRAIDGNWNGLKCDKSLYKFYEVIHNSCQNYNIILIASEEAGNDTPDVSTYSDFDGLKHSTPVASSSSRDPSPHYPG